jgi:glycerophosphoryl diester phosphodiesterase
MVNAALLEQAAGAGLTVHPWTVDDEEDVRRFIEGGVASVITNLPDVALAVRDGPARAGIPADRTAGGTAEP